MSPWHFLYFLPLPQGQGSLRPTLVTELSYLFRTEQLYILDGVLAFGDGILMLSPVSDGSWPISAANQSRKAVDIFSAALHHSD